LEAKLARLQREHAELVRKYQELERRYKRLLRVLQRVAKALEEATRRFQRLRQRALQEMQPHQPRARYGWWKAHYRVATLTVVVLQKVSGVLQEATG